MKTSKSPSSSRSINFGLDVLYSVALKLNGFTTASVKSGELFVPIFWK